MVRSAVVFAALFIPCLAVAQTTTTTTTATGPDGRPATVTITRSPDGVNGVVIAPGSQGAGAPALPVPNGMPARDTAPATGTSVVRGRIIDAQSGAPLRRASVRIFSPQIRESRTALTDAEG